MKCYVVFKGRRLGVYNTWAECHDQISRYPGNLHQTYRCRNEAEAALAKYEAMQPPNQQAYVKEGWKQPSEMKIASKWTWKDAIISILVVVVLIQSYVLYH